MPHGNSEPAGGGLAVEASRWIGCDTANLVRGWKRALGVDTDRRRRVLLNVLSVHQKLDLRQEVDLVTRGGSNNTFR